MARKIAVIDSETDPFLNGRIPKPFLWGFYDGKIYREFKTAIELAEFLAPQKLIVYAHNGGKFDYHFLLNEIGAFQEITLINNRLAKFRIGECEFRDSMNILPVSLATYQKTEIEYWKFEENVRHEHISEISSYLRDDCFYLYQFVKEFLDTYGINITLASAAFKQWKKISNKPAPQTDQITYNELAPYYYGGRVECFQKGIINETFNVFDINSAYPYAMTFEHPYGSTYTMREGCEYEKIIEQNFYTIIAVSRGGLPFRDLNNSLTFPDDQEVREYHVTGWEIIAAQDLNCLEIYSIPTVISFSERIEFNDYVDHFYELKKNATKGSPEYIYAKLFLNSLYGKFASNPNNYNEFMIIPPQYIEVTTSGKKNFPPTMEVFNKEGWEFAGDFGTNALIRRDLDDEDKRFYNVAVSASITGFVRAYLFRAIKSVGNPYYCDTDSIAFSGLHTLTIGNELGAWDNEGEFDSAAIAGKKLYAFRNSKNGKEKIASKGSRINSDQIFEIAKGETITYNSEAPTFSPFNEPSFLSRRIKMT